MLRELTTFPSSTGAFIQLSSSMNPRTQIPLFLLINSQKISVAPQLLRENHIQPLKQENHSLIPRPPPPLSIHNRDVGISGATCHETPTFTCHVVDTRGIHLHPTRPPVSPSLPRPIASPSLTPITPSPTGHGWSQEGSRCEPWESGFRHMLGTVPALMGSHQ